MTNFRVSAHGAFASGRTWSFRTHVATSSDLATTLFDWAAQLDSFWTNGSHGVETIYPTTTTLNLVRVAELSALFRETQIATSPASLVGTSANDALPDHEAILVSLRGPVAGKAGRGRIHLPALDETLVDENVIQSTPATRVATSVDALFSGMRTAGYSFFVYNRAVSTHDPVAFTPKTILSQDVDRVIRSMRPRTRKLTAVYV